MPPSMIAVRIQAKRPAADDIQTFELVAADGGALPPFSAGAHIDVEVEPGVLRQYSLCNRPGETERYRIAVLRDPASRGGSVRLHDAFAEGEAVNISPPRNHFELAPGASRSILIAGGIGVTPLLSMAAHLQAEGADFEFHYCTRSPARTAFHDELVRGDFADRLILHFDDGPDHQRFNPDKALGAPQPGVHIYVCGPQGFIDWVLASARSQGWSDGQLHREYFSASPIVVDGDQAFEVRVNSTGAVYPIPADRTVVEVLADHGIEIPVSCQQGICGTCITRVIEGEPDHRDMVLMGTEMDEFAPCCSRARTPLLVLDL
ncbi:oxidoreductase [Brevundimonas sp. S30B]|uniref:PDR/VanB family oxidoreductase n=1 Tax=unclassified Brevundimonas TaxID=2622653 RepID=UPI0010726F16|nr:MULTISPECIES: PDR/VanB family oxidoreductase [unclassified Brevundimonas]QBX36676.1 oxidoreductase [Brevundimonas sp. MF30-B]TFW04529.1 oxidoreductase [Brevundimonas sp. S30B]